MDEEEIVVNLDDENENIDVNEESFIYINIPESIITEIQDDIEELKADSGNKVALSINSNYVMTLQLLNKANEVLSTGTIDLPIESMVVNASYSNGILTLTLQNGQTLDVDISAIISGLQQEITVNNKLSSDLVDDTNKTNKFVTTTEKTTWGNKYDKPAGGIPKTDLTSEVQTSLGKADTALQEHQDISGKEDKSNKVTELTNESTNTQYPSAKCVYDSQAEQDNKIEAIENLVPTGNASGSDITLSDSARYKFKEMVIGGKSEQDGEPSIENEVPIQNVTGDVNIKIKSKNWLNNRATSTSINGINYTVNSDKTILCNGTATANAILVVQTYAQSDLVPAGDYKISIGNALPSNNSFLRVEASTNKSTAIQTFDVKNMQTESTVTLNQASYLKISLLIANTYTANNLLIKPMIREASITNDEFEPHEEQTVNFPLSEGQVLHLGDTIEDKIVQRRKTITLDGSETYGRNGEGTDFYLFTVQSFANIIKKSNILDIKCNMLEASNATKSGTIKITSTGNIVISVTKDFCEYTISSIKTKIKELYDNGTPMIIEIPLAEPIEIEFTQEQTIAKAQIDELYSYKAGTHIISNADLDITYVKDFDVYEKTTNDRLDALEARLELLEG